MQNQHSLNFFLKQLKMKIRIPSSVIRVETLEREASLFACSKKDLSLWNPRIGEAFTVCSNSYVWLRARLEKSLDDKYILRAFEKIKNPEPEIAINLYQAVPQKERMELIIEKAAELGVSRVIPVITSKSSSVKKRDEKQKKSHNWPKLALKASKQCRRGSVLEICSEIELKRCFEGLKSDLNIFLNEKETDFKIKNVDLKNIRSVSVFNGPEGGFSEPEREFFKKNGVFSVTLGPRILRTETAAISACSFFSLFL